MISQENLTTATYTFLILGGLIALLANLFVYFYKKSRHKQKGR